MSSDHPSYTKISMGHFRVPQPLYENEVGAKFLISSHANDGQFDMEDFALGLIL